MNETIKHLELIQSVINRMAQVSFIIKGWAVTLVAGLLALAVNAECWYYSLLALLPALVFWGLDAFYLRQERLFRHLYDNVRLGQAASKVPLFSMDTTEYQVEVNSWLSTLKAPTILSLHGLIAAVAIAVTIVIRLS